MVRCVAKSHEKTRRVGGGSKMKLLAFGVIFCFYSFFMRHGNGRKKMHFIFLGSFDIKRKKKRKISDFLRILFVKTLDNNLTI